MKITERRSPNYRYFHSQVLLPSSVPVGDPVNGEKLFKKQRVDTGNVNG